MTNTIKVTILKDIEATEVEVKMLTPGLIWISKNPYILWQESNNYECEDLYDPIAERLGKAVTSEWWPYDKDNDELTAPDTSGFPLGEWHLGYWAFCKDLNNESIQLGPIPGLTPWLIDTLERMKYTEGDYDHYLFQLGNSILYKASKRFQGTDYCPTHTSYYRWCLANKFEYDDASEDEIENLIKD
jgi:hypothetical protein